MGTFKKMLQQFQETFRHLDLGWGMTLTEEEPSPVWISCYTWKEGDNRIEVCLKRDGDIVIYYSYASGDLGQEFSDIEHLEEVKDFILNFIDNIYHEED